MMEKGSVFVTEDELTRQEDFSARVLERLRACEAETGQRHTAFVDCYGCQQNEADAERMRGVLLRMGYDMAPDEQTADLVLINTCAVRDHAEMRVLGNIGALSHLKKARPGMIIAVGGCMPQQPHVAEQLKKSYPYVDIVFGTHALWRLPELIYRQMTEKHRIYDVADEDGRIAEGLPVLRKDNIRGWVSIMYGCDNFCSYCVVPYVRGRERSRRPEDVLAEVRELIDAGCREINLLGQNVNSYGKDAGYMDFTNLLYRVCEIPGNFILRFMTSHPKDVSLRLIDAIADAGKVAPQFHLPVQSGSDRILAQMNRNYTAAGYLEFIDYAKERIPGIALTSDVIVGFPGEDEEDFQATLRLVEQVRYHSLFTFKFSPRKGTPAAEMTDDTPETVRDARFMRLLDVQNRISEELHREYIGKTLPVLADGISRMEEYPISARTMGGRPVYLKAGAESIGQFLDAKVTRCSPWALYGEDARL